MHTRHSGRIPAAKGMVVGAQKLHGIELSRGAYTGVPGDPCVTRSLKDRQKEDRVGLGWRQVTLCLRLASFVAYAPKA